GAEFFHESCVRGRLLRTQARWQRRLPRRARNEHNGGACARIGLRGRHGEVEALLASAFELEIDLSQDLCVEQRAVSAWTFARAEIETVAIEFEPLGQRIQ